MVSGNNKREVARFPAGKSFGEMAIVEAMPRSTTCYAITNTELLKFSVEDFSQFIWNHPMIGVKILKEMSRNMTAWLFDANNFLTSMVMWGEKARFRAITDEATGLFNRRFFEESMDLNIIKAKNKNIKFCLLMFDLDNFHGVNQRLGTIAGDKIIKKVADLFSSCFSNNAVISRLGGDEFAALLPDSSVQDALPIAKKFKNNLENIKIRFSNKKQLQETITISISIVECPTHALTSEKLMKIADKALYLAKDSGRNRIVCAGKK